MSPESVTFDRAATFYDETRGFPPGEETHIASLINEVAGLTASSRVIEVGIGTGRIALPLAKQVGSVTGIDLSRPMLQRLRGKQTDEPVYIVEGDATRLPFASRSFDVAVAVHIFHLIPSWYEAAEEVARVLRPGALLVHAGGIPRSYDPLWEAWSARHLDSRRTVGPKYEEINTSLMDHGWQQIGQLRTYEYTFEQPPQLFLDQLQNRAWSWTWPWSDELLAECVAFMQKAVRERFGDPQQPAKLTGNFYIRVFLPPQG